MTDSPGGFSLVFFFFFKGRAALLRSVAQPYVSSGGKIKDLFVLELGELCVPVRTGMVLNLLWPFFSHSEAIICVPASMVAGGRRS